MTLIWFTHQGTQNYDSQIGINIYPLAVGKYTIIMEYYFPEDTGISLSCSASTAVIAKQTTKKLLRLYETSCSI